MRGTKTISTRLGWHVATIEKTLALVAKGVLPVYRTIPQLSCSGKLAYHLETLPLKMLNYASLYTSRQMTAVILLLKE